MTKQWYVLAHADTGSDLIRCTPDTFETIDIMPEAQSAFGTQLQNKVGVDVVEEGGRYVPDGAAKHVSGASPRATFTNNDVSNRGAHTEQHLKRVGAAVREQMGSETAPLMVAMDPARFALFEAVSKIPVSIERLDVSPGHASAEQLWKLSRQRLS